MVVGRLIRLANDLKNRILAVNVELATIFEERVKLWKSMGRRARELGIALLGLSIPMYGLAFLTASVLFELTAVLSLFLGIVFVFTGVESHMRLRPANLMAKSPLMTVKDMLEREDHKGNIEYKYDEQGKPNAQIINGGSNGYSIYPLGNELMGLYEEELGDLKERGIEYVADWIPRVLVESLGLADKIDISYPDKDRVRVSIQKPSFEMLCLSQDLKRGICDRVGCQVQGSIGQAISKSTGRRVSFEGCLYDVNTRTSTSTYKLGA
ncbi:MAG: hypothetical protein V3U49_00215 [Nitrososphaerales archaeon]